MRCLWLTWIDPSPEHDGQRIYSGRLIDAVAEAGAHVDVLCFESDQSLRHDGGTETDTTVRWALVPQEARPAWRSFFSPLPHVAHRSGTRAMKKRLAALLRERRWDNIVMDGLYTGWALPVIKACLQTQTHKSRLIYISHNHEETTRTLVAHNYRGNLLINAALLRDAHKASQLERRMVDRADIITAITHEDARQYGARRPEKPILVLPPGYAGRRLKARQIGPDLPRRALLVGSFEWLAKQMNLREFLAVADPIFAAAGVVLQVVGNGEEAFFDSLRPDLKSTEIVGPVDDITPYLDQARIAIIPERSGGGFKLKVLDYIFNRLPVAALEHSIAGLPLTRGEGVLTFPHYHDLATGVVEAMDDFNLLNNIQEQAFLACTNAFDWSMRGQHLMSALVAESSQTEPLTLGAGALEPAR
jgi:hypothetical protein